jgi:ribonucleotide reductase alpha subunit
VGSRHPAAGLAEAAGEERGGYLKWTTETLDWAPCARIAEHGMRNSNCVAIAPTATISNIIGVSACIEPTFQNLYVKSNLSGEFTVINEYLVRDLKARGLWDEVMVADLKYFDGSWPHRPHPARPARHLRHRLRSRSPGWWKPPRVARSGSTRPSR